MKHVLVLWSGGLDSTYLIQKNLSEGNKVDAGYACIKGNGNDDSEKRAIEKLSEIFKKEYDKKFNYLGVLTESSVFANGLDNVTLKQVPTWLNTLLYSCTHCGDPYSEVQIGYVQNDDAISFLDDIRKAWRGFRGLVDHLPPITFPLAKICKETGLWCLDERYLRFISFCEHPEGDTACGECSSCKRMLRTIETAKEWWRKDTLDYFKFKDKRQLIFDFELYSAIKLKSKDSIKDIGKKIEMSEEDQQELDVMLDKGDETKEIKESS